VKKVFTVMLFVFCLVGLAAGQGKKGVVVCVLGKVPYSARGVQKELITAVEEYLVQSSKYNAEYSVLNRDSDIVDAIDKEKNYQERGRVSQEEVKKWAKQKGAIYLCTIKISDESDKNSVTLTRLNVETGETHGLKEERKNISFERGDDWIKLVKGMTEFVFRDEEDKAIYEGVKVREEMHWRTRSNIKLAVGLSLDVAGVGLLGYGLYKDISASSRIKEGNAEMSDIKGMFRTRDICYIVGGVLLVSGVSMQIFF